VVCENLVLDGAEHLLIGVLLVIEGALGRLLRTHIRSKPIFNSHFLHILHIISLLYFLHHHFPFILAFLFIRQQIQIILTLLNMLQLHGADRDVLEFGRLLFNNLPVNLLCILYLIMLHELISILCSWYLYLDSILSAFIDIEILVIFKSVF